MDRFDSMRSKLIIQSGGGGGETPDEDANIEQVINEIYTWCGSHGAYMPALTNLENLTECVKSISEIEKITVSFNTGTEEIIPSQTGIYGHPMSLPKPTTVPEEGQTFDCWLLNGTPVYDSTPISGDCTLVARWMNKVYIMASPYNSTNVIGYNARINKAFRRQDCRSITFLTDGSVPENAVTSWDVSLDNDGSVMAYIDTNSTNVAYNLYISGKGKIFMPASSAYWFYYYGFNSTITIKNILALDTSNVTNMSYMFSELGVTGMLDLGSFNTSNVTNMNYMFNGAKMSALNVVGFDTKKVTQLYYTFNGCRDLTSLNLSTFEVDSCNDFRFAWTDCYNLQQLDIRNMSLGGKSKQQKDIVSTTTAVTAKVYCKDTASKTWLIQHRFASDNIFIVGE